MTDQEKKRQEVALAFIDHWVMMFGERPDLTEAEIEQVLNTFDYSAYSPQ